MGWCQLGLQFQVRWDGKYVGGGRHHLEGPPLVVGHLSLMVGHQLSSACCWFIG